MNNDIRPWIEIDWSTFDPWRVQGPLRHRLMDHPLLQWDALRGLAERLEPLGQYRSHTSEATASTSFNDAPRLCRNRKSPTEILSDVSGAHAWMSLLNVQTDRVYRGLVDEVLDGIRPGIEAHDPGMSYRAGWIFLASPNAVTPFHFDTEHNVILQLKGHKTLYVWEPDDVEAASEEARDRFHAYHDRSLLVWREALRARAHKFHLEPGVGAYMPCTSPHLVENDDNPSLTMSFTFYTGSTRRGAALHRTHAWLRGLGVKPAPVGQRPLLDSLNYALYDTARAGRRALQRLRGRPIERDDAPYAYAKFT